MAHSSTSLSEKTSSLPDSPRSKRSSNCAFFRGQSEITISLALGNGSGTRLGLPKSALNESRAMNFAVESSFQRTIATQSVQLPSAQGKGMTGGTTAQTTVAKG
jgi:hypothetical protein